MAIELIQATTDIKLSGYGHIQGPTGDIKYISGSSQLNFDSSSIIQNANQDDENDISFYFDIRSTKPKINIVDNLDYNALGWDIDDVVATVIFTGPGGAIYYNDDTDNPDIIPSVNRALKSNIYIPLDESTDYENIFKGNYTIKVVWYNSVLYDTYVYIQTYNYNFDKPEITNTTVSGPYSGTLKSTDTTDYGDDVYTLSREHRISYPTQLDPAIADVVSTEAEVSVTPIYTNQWTITINTYVEYRQSDFLRILWEDEAEFTHCVYGGCIGAMYDAIKTLLTNYDVGYPTNIDAQERYQKRLTTINTAWHLLNVAYQQGDVEEADAQAYIIQRMVNYTGDGVCLGATSEEVTPCDAYDPGDGGSTEYTFENGLTELGGVVRLGGSLTQNTTVNLVDKTLSFSSTASGSVAIVTITPGNSIVQVVNDGSIESKLLLTTAYASLSYRDINTPANSKEYRVLSSGISEVDDYTGSYTPRTLVAKSYVDDALSGFEATITSDDTLIGSGTAASPLVVANPFPGFSDLNTDYGYEEPTHEFGDLTSTPTTIAGYGITDAFTRTQLQTSGGSSVHWDNITNAPTFGSDYVPIAGGEFTGQITITTTDDYVLVLKQTGAGSTPGTPESGTNRIAFLDNDGDLQGYVGIGSGGDLELRTEVTGGAVKLLNNVSVSGDIAVTGSVDGVDISAFYAAYLIHEHDWDQINNAPNFVIAENNYFPNQFDLKSSASANDRLLIEDSDDDYIKKYVLFNTLPAPVSSFIGLNDVPSSYSGAGNYLVKVNAAGDGLEFINSNNWLSTANGTLNSLSEKLNATGSDILIIEDAADSFTQKKTLLGNLNVTGGTGYSVSMQNLTLTANVTYTITTSLRPYLAQFYKNDGSRAFPAIRIIPNGGDWDIQVRSSIDIVGYISYVSSSTASVHTRTVNIVNGLNNLNTYSTIEPKIVQIFDSNGVLMTGLTTRKRQNGNWYVDVQSSNISTISNAVLTWI